MDVVVGVGFVVLILLVGFILSWILGITEYLLNKRKVKDCKHLEWKFDDKYTYRVYDADKENPKTCERYTCYHCGKVEYKEWRINNGN